MEQFATSPLALCSSVKTHRGLILALVKRDVLGRYRGSMLGLGWSLLHPLVMLGLYTFVFGAIFRSRWGINAEGGEVNFALALFAGLLVFNIFSECVNRAPTLVTSNANFVKRIIFPLEILPCVALLSSLFHGTISLSLLCAAHLLVYGSLPWTVTLFPIVILPLCLASLGLGWIFSSLGVYIRDINQITGMITTVLLFLSAVFFPASAIPSQFADVLRLNPLTHIIEASRAVLVVGTIPELVPMVALTLVSIIVAYLGFVWFQKSRRGFADVL